MKRLVEVELSLATVRFCGGFEGTGDSKQTKVQNRRISTNGHLSTTAMFQPLYNDRLSTMAKVAVVKRFNCIFTLFIEN